MIRHRITQALRRLAPFWPALLVLGAALPLGSVHPTYRFSLATMLWLLTGWVFALRPAPARSPARTRAALRGGFALLLAWSLLQCLPIRSLWTDGSSRPWISAEPRYSMLSTLVWASYVAFALATARLCRGREKWGRAAFALMAVGVVESLWAFARFAHPLPESDPFHSHRFRGTFSSGNALGGFLLLTLAASLGLLLHQWPAVEKEWVAARNRGRHIVLRWMDRGSRLLLPACACTVQAACLVMTGSRGALLAAVVLLGVLVIRFLKPEPPARLSMRLPVVLAGLALLGALGLGGGLWIARQRLANLLPSEEEGSASFSMRRELWSATLREIQRQPLGVGLGNFEEAYALALPSGPAGERAYHAHNDYLEVTAELGLPGMAILLVLLVAFLARHAEWLRAGGEAGPPRWLPRALWAGLLASLVHAAVDFNLSSRPAVTLAFFLCAGLLEAARASALPDSPSRSARAARRAPLQLKPLLCTAVPAVLTGIHALGAWYTEKGWVAAGGAPDRFLGQSLWVPAPSDPWFALATRLSPLDATPLARRAEAVLFLEDSTRELREAWLRQAFFPAPPGPFREAARQALRGESLRVATRLTPLLDALLARTGKPGLLHVLEPWTRWLSGAAPHPRAPGHLPGQHLDGQAYLRLLALHLSATPPGTPVDLKPVITGLHRYPKRARDVLDLLPEDLALDDLLTDGYSPLVFQVLAERTPHLVRPGTQELFFQYWSRALDQDRSLDPRKLRRMRRDWVAAYVGSMVAKGDWGAAQVGQEQFRAHRALSTPSPSAPTETRPALLLLEKNFQESEISAQDKAVLLEWADGARKSSLASDLRASLQPLAPAPPVEGRVETGLTFGNDALDWIGYQLARDPISQLWTFTAWLRPRRALPVDLEMRVGILVDGIEYAAASARLQDAAPDLFHLGDPVRNEIFTAIAYLPVQTTPESLDLSFLSPRNREALPTLEGLPSLVFPTTPP